MSTLEHELAQKISRLSEEEQHKVLEYVRNLERNLEGVTKETLSARELIKLPTAERQRLVKAAFELAADEDFETFEAYGEEAIDESP